MQKGHSKYIKSIATLFGLLLCYQLLLAEQNPKTDSLLTLLKSDKQDTNRVIHLYQLTREYNLSENPTKGVYYGNEAVKLAKKLNFTNGIAKGFYALGESYDIIEDYSNALKNYTEALNEYLRINNNEESVTIYEKMGTIFDKEFDYPKAVDYYLKALYILEKENRQDNLAKLYGTVGIVYDKQANYPTALSYYLKALAISEKQGDEKQISRNLGNIGSVYYSLSDYPKALDYYFRGLRLSEKIKDKKKIAAKLSNIGMVYKSMADDQSELTQKEKLLEKSLNYYFKALDIYKGLNEKSNISSILGNIGSTYRAKRETNSALDNYNKALLIAREIEDKSRIAIWLGNIGELYIDIGQYARAESYLKEAISVADGITALDYLMQFEELLTKVYDKTGKYQLAFNHYQKMVALKDTIFNQENKKQLIQKEMNYEFEKKEAITKAENDKQKSIAKEKERVQNIVIASVLLGLLIVIIFASFIFKTLRITRKQKNTIESQKNEVSKQKEIVEKQKHIVEEKQKEIIDSITYAKRIQTALLTSEQYIQKNLPAEYFILFKPKDIVSGDFYWAFRHLTKSKEEQNESFYIITADCTGHGVPGAFMSMLNISYLNENVIEKGIKAPHEILNAQRTEVITALNPKDSQVSTKDGMDCVLCAYDFDNMVLHFAAANNPLWLIRNNELIEYKADKMPVGKYSEIDDTSFTLQTITLEKGDVIYTSTDGYGDQFGMSGKKLMKKRFKEKLIEIHKAPMHQQKTLLDAFFENWKGTTEQVDDVCVIGVKI